MKITAEELKAKLGNPGELEKIYRADRRAFKAAFDKIYPDIENTEPAKFWQARLEYDTRTEKIKIPVFSELVKVISVCAIVAFFIRIPAIFQMAYSEDVFYMKNAALIVFFGLILYNLWLKGKSDRRGILIISLAFLLSAIYINLLPSDVMADPVTLAYIHLPVLLWFIYGIVFTDFDIRDHKKRIGFIRYNGDLAIVFALIAIAGGLLTSITIGLFESIGLNIENFYIENIVITGAVAAPVVASFIIEKLPTLVSRIAPVIAAIFSPLVLITLLVFLVTVMVTGKDPYNDRDFLLVFNVMLLGVMGIIIFSVSETSEIRNQKFNAVVLFVLSVITILIDLIALSAIFYRLREYGLTPNRLAVLVSNILVLINLSLIMTDLFRINIKKKDFNLVEKTVSGFLPVYLLWIIVVIFGFPLIFGMK